MGQAIAEYDNNVYLFCTSDKARVKIKAYKIFDVNIVEFPDFLWGKFRQGVDIWNTIRRIVYSNKININLVHAIDCRPVVIFSSLYLKKIKKKPLLISWWDLFGDGGTSVERSGKIYSFSLGFIESFFDTYFRQFADYSIVVTTYLQNKLKALGYPISKIEIHRVGCHVEKIECENKITNRRELNLAENKIILCFLGSLFEKDKQLLIASLEILKTKTKELPLTIIIGKTILEKKYCDKLSIKLLGRIKSSNAVRQILAASDFALVPMKINIANKARWPSKTADYWSMGLPVISTPISDYGELFPKYNLGFLSKSDLPEDYAEAIFEAINSSVENRKVKQDSIYNYVKSELNWSVLSKRLSNLYEKIL